MNAEISTDGANDSNVDILKAKLQISYNNTLHIDYIFNIDELIASLTSCFLGLFFSMIIFLTFRSKSVFTHSTS